MKVIRVRYYDRLGRVTSNGNMAYITFHVGKAEKPEDGDLLVQVTNVEGVPVLVAKFITGEFLAAFRKPEDVKSLDELEKYGVPAETIEEIRKVCREKGITWV